MTTWNAAPMPELGLELVRDVDRERFRSRLPRWDPRLWGDAQFSKNTRPGNRLLKLGLAWGRERVKARELQPENVTPPGDAAPVSRFTGKEEDVEVGLQYFGKRYLSPYLGRWISADPLAVHSPGSADLNLYAYVSGTVLKSIDPIGLQGYVPGYDWTRVQPAGDLPPEIKQRQWRDPTRPLSNPSSVHSDRGNDEQCQRPIAAVPFQVGCGATSVTNQSLEGQRLTHSTAIRTTK
jgi:RHS repeat-associated protein